MSLEFGGVNCALHQTHEVLVLQAGVIVTRSPDMVTVRKLIFTDYLSISIFLHDHILSNEVFLNASHHHGKSFIWVQLGHIDEKDFFLFL